MAMSGGKASPKSRLRISPTGRATAGRPQAANRRRILRRGRSYGPFLPREHALEPAPGAVEHDHAQHLADPVAGRFRKHPPPRRHPARLEAHQRRRPPDAAVDQRRIGAGEVERRDRDAVPKARRHDRGAAPVARPQRPGALGELDVRRLVEAERAEGRLHPLGAHRVGDAGGGGVRRMDEKLRHGDGPAERVIVVDAKAPDRHRRGIDLLCEVADNARLHRRRHRHRLHRRAELIDAHRRAIVERRRVGAPGGVGVEAGRRGHGDDLAGIDAEDAGGIGEGLGDGNDEDVGRGVTGDIDPRSPGMESWASRNGLFTAAGREQSAKPGPTNFMIWWDGDLLRELLDGGNNRPPAIYKWNYQNGSISTMFNPSGVLTNNGTKSTPSLSADILGDWREELIARSSNNSQLVIYTTTYPTDHRLYTLMHNPQYRVAIAWQNTAYNQPPHPSFFIGDGMAPQPVPDINTPRGGSQPEPLPAPADVLQVQENAAGFCAVDGVIEAINGGFTGAGYANSNNAAGAFVRWAVNAPAAGNYMVAIRYAGVTDRPATVRINGSIVQNNLPLITTSAWTSWSSQTLTVALNNGNNVIELAANGADGLPNIDWLQVGNKDATPGTCP